MDFSSTRVFSYAFHTPDWLVTLLTSALVIGCLLTLSDWFLLAGVWRRAVPGRGAALRGRRVDARAAA